MLGQSILLVRDQIPARLLEFFEPAECGKCFVCQMVAVFREVRRVLRKDGTVWLNLGDSYSTHAAGKVADPMRASTLAGANKKTATEANRVAASLPNELKRGGMPEKNLLGIPWRVAFALQAEGWYLRQDIIWSKPNPMPESVRDRCTKSHEYLFLLTKSPTYFYDNEAIAEASVADHPSGNGFKRDARLTYQNADGTPRGNDKQWSDVGGTRNRRSVWTITTTPFPEAHFATFPPELPELCIKAGTSEKGCCPQCGAPWGRVVEEAPDDRVSYATVGAGAKAAMLGKVNPVRKVLREDGRGGDLARKKVTQLGWQPFCSCPEHQPIPCTVLDPFGGAGTTGLVADRLQRNAILIELNPSYAEMARKRITGDAPLFAETGV